MVQKESCDVHPDGWELSEARQEIPLFSRNHKHGIQH